MLVLPPAAPVDARGAHAERRSDWFNGASHMKRLSSASLPREAPGMTTGA